MSAAGRSLELHEQALELVRQNRLVEAEEKSAEALHCLRDEDHPMRIRVARDLTQIRLQTGKYALALESLDVASSALDRWGGSLGNDDVALLRITILALRGTALRMIGRYDVAEADLRNGVAIAEGQFGPDHVQVAVMLNHLGMLLKYRGKLDEAKAAYARALAIVEREGAGDSSLAATLWHNIGGVLHASGRFAEAEIPARRACEIRTRLLGADHPETVADLAALAGILDGLERWDESEPLHRAAIKFWERFAGPRHYEVAVALNNLAGACAATGRVDEAERHYRRAIDVKRSLLGSNHPELALTLANLAGLLRDIGRPGEGKTLAEDALRVVTVAGLATDHPLRTHAEAVLRDFDQTRPQREGGS
jgi:tetratricopeptide (TPR) repeat protein